MLTHEAIVIQITAFEGEPSLLPIVTKYKEEQRTKNLEQTRMAKMTKSCFVSSVTSIDRPQ